MSSNAFHASCEFSSHLLTRPKGVSFKLMIRKSHALDFPSYIFILSSSFYDYCSVGTSTSFVRYLRVPWCLEVALDFTYNHQACLSLHWNLFIWWLLPSTLFIPLGLMPFSSLWGVTSFLIKRVKISLSRVIVLYFLLFKLKNYGYLVNPWLTSTG